MEKHTAAITIRSFDTHGPAMATLLRACRIIYHNTTGERLPEEVLSSALSGAEIAIAGTELFTRRVIESAEALRIISRVGIGTDSIDLEAARKREITVFTTPEAPVQAVAEHTLALTLAVIKNLGFYHEEMRRGFQGLRLGLLLEGKQVGVVGLGRIGTRVAAMFESLGCSIAFFDPSPRGTPKETWQRASSLQELAASSGILTLHTPAQPGNSPLIDGGMLASCKRGIIIINTARGSLIDEEAMISALDEGTIAGAGLDALPSEPYSGPLLSYPQVIATPHVASNTVETRSRMEREAVEQVIAAIERGAL